MKKKHSKEKSGAPYSLSAGGDITKWTFTMIDRVYYLEIQEEKIGWKISADGGTNISDGTSFGCMTWKSAHVLLTLLCPTSEDGCLILNAI